jgi:ribose transport system permease protein
MSTIEVNDTDVAKPRHRFSTNWIGTQLGRFSLVLVLALFIAGFSIAKPVTFADLGTLRSIASINIPTLFLAFAATLPFVVGEFDLSIYSIAVFSQCVVIDLVEVQHVPVILAFLIALAGSAIIGTFNGVAIAVFRFSSFIVTLATGSLVAGIFLAITRGQTIYLMAPHALTMVARNTAWGIPLPVYYGAFAATVLSLVLTRTSVGRRMYATGSNQRAALLTGIATRRYIILTFVVGAILSSFAGIILASNLGSAYPDQSGALLIPAFAGAFLGATAFTPGRFNILGTLVAVYVVGVVVAGLQQFGVAQWVTPTFDGMILFASVVLQVWTSRSRARAAAKARLRELEDIAASEQA